MSRRDPGQDGRAVTRLDTETGRRRRATRDDRDHSARRTTTHGGHRGDPEVLPSTVHQPVDRRRRGTQDPIGHRLPTSVNQTLHHVVDYRRSTIVSRSGP